MYWEQTAAMRVEGEISAFQKIKRGVRQGCVLSPDLFSLYSEIIMRNIRGSFIYIMTATRPDLCFIVTKLSQYLSMPDDTHMIIAKHVLRYLKATTFERLTFRKSVDNLS